MSRSILHIAILIYAIFVAQTPSIIVLVAPIWIICFVAATRNKNENFDAIDLFWVLYQLSFVAAPGIRVEEEYGSFLFSKGVKLEWDVGTYLYYDQTQIFMLYGILAVVAFINLLVLPKTVRVLSKKSVGFRLPIGLFIAAILVSFTLEIILKGGIVNVLAGRRLKGDAVGGAYTMLVVTNTLALCFLFVSQLTKERRLKKVTGLCVVFGVLMTLYNPFNAPRFFIIQAYMPVFLMLFPKLMRFSALSTGLVLGLFILMPILSLTSRRGFGADISDLTLTSSSALGFLDQHAVLLQLIDHVSTNGLEFGSSILSVLLFFVPRAAWPGKPEVWGLVVGKDLYDTGFVGTANLSGPIIGDFYLDFGLIGLVVGSFLTAYFFRKLLKVSLIVNDFPIINLAVMAGLPILFRGSVGAVLPLVTFTIVYLYIYVFLAHRVKWKIK